MRSNGNKFCYLGQNIIKNINCIEKNQLVFLIEVVSYYSK